MASALLVGKNLSRSHLLMDWLRERGVDCYSVISCLEAEALLRGHSFNVVLSEICPEDSCAAQLIQLLSGTGASLFFSLPVEDSCWWVPAVAQGEPCFGSPALRPHAFSESLRVNLRVASPVSGAARGTGRM